MPGYYAEVALIAQPGEASSASRCRCSAATAGSANRSLKIAGKRSKARYFSTHFSADDKSPSGAGFREKHTRRKYGETPDAMAALGYDSRDDPGRRDQARRHAPTAESCATPSPRRRITTASPARSRSTRSATRTKPAVILTIKDGKFQFVETVAP